MRALHQFVAGYAHRDAISNEARVLRERFRAWGLASDIFCPPRNTAPELRADARSLDDAAAALGPDDGVLLHLSIGSPVNDLFPTLPGRKALLYHNVTPPEFFRGINEGTVRVLSQGRDQLQRLAGTAEIVLADSAFNAGELEAAGHARAAVFPLALDFGQLRSRPDSALLRAYTGEGLINVLFVGRGAPNKRLEDLLSAFYFFQRYVAPDSRLLHVGSFAGTERYEALLHARVREWGLRNVDFRGSTSQAGLAACYRAAHVFLCLSEHEGFCIPLVEALAHDVPVLAYDAGAVAETLGGAGVLVREKRFDLIAELLGRLARDSTLRAAILARQRRRLADFEQRDLDAELRAHFAAWGMG